MTLEYYKLLSIWILSRTFRIGLTLGQTVVKDNQEGYKFLEMNPAILWSRCRIQQRRPGALELDGDRDPAL